MELLNTLYNLMGLVFVLGTIISMGLSLTMKQITGPLRNVRFRHHGLARQLCHPTDLPLSSSSVSLPWMNRWRWGCCWFRWRRAHRDCPKRPFLPKLIPRPPPA